MEEESYYNVQASKLNLVLLELNNLGYGWLELDMTKSPISKYYNSSLGYDFDNPVLKVNQKHKEVILTSKELLKSNNNTEKVFTYSTLIQDLDLKLEYLRPKYDWFFQLFGQKAVEKNYKKYLNKKLSDANKSLESLSWYLCVEKIEDQELVDKYEKLQDNVEFIKVLMNK